MDLIHDDTIDTWAHAHPASATLLWTWRTIVHNATWHSPHDVQQTFPKASIITVKPNTLPSGLTRIIFNIGSSRLVTHIKFQSNIQGMNGCVFLRWFGSHADYDQIDWTLSTKTNI